MPKLTEVALRHGDCAVAVPGMNVDKQGKIADVHPSYFGDLITGLSGQLDVLFWPQALCQQCSVSLDSIRREGILVPRAVRSMCRADSAVQRTHKKEVRCQTVRK